MIIPLPTWTEADEEIELINQVKSFDPSKLIEFENCRNWKCLSCKSVNFGRNKSCAYCHGRLKRHTPRPDY